MNVLQFIFVFMGSFLCVSNGAPATPYLDVALSHLRRLAPNAEDHLWKLTHGNKLNTDWLLQTPDCWGDANPNVNCAMHNAPGAQELASLILKKISSATQWVDIATLAFGKDIATGIFHEAIVQGIRQAHAAYPNITFRILGGTAVSKSDGMSASYLKRLLADLGSDANDIRIFVSGIEPYWAKSWNHAKIVAIDGKVALVGGHNLVDGDYNGDHPINDVSMWLEGPAANMAHEMANLLWTFACENVHIKEKVGFARAPAVLTAPCPKIFSQELPQAPGKISILALGSLGFGMKSFDNTSGAQLLPTHDSRAACSSIHKDHFNNDAQFIVDNPDSEAMRVVIDSAKKNIFIAQQDLMFDYCSWWNKGFVSAIYDTRLFDIIAKKLIEGLSVTIVVSTPQADGDCGGYSYMKKLVEIPNALLRKFKQRNVSAIVAKATMCKHLRLASARIMPNMSKWHSRLSIGQHAKVFAVDDSVFYIGSHNLYPTQLQEFGYLVEDLEAAQHLKVSFLDKLWLYSREAAIIDFEAGKCDIAPKGFQSNVFEIHSDKLKEVFI